MHSLMGPVSRWTIALGGLAGSLCGASCNLNRLDSGSPDLAAPAQQPDLTPQIFSDFPATPIVDSSGGALPANIATLFGPPQSGAQSGGPCVLEPQPGSLYPNNWLRLQVRLQQVGGQNVSEIRLHAANQENDLVVYTSAATYTLPAAVWQGLTAHTQDQPIHVTVRGAVLSGGALSGPPALGMSGDIAIAPAQAEGNIVYWAIDQQSGATALNGFAIGEEVVHPLYTPAAVGTACIGCHSSTPDGYYVGLSESAVAGNGDPAQVDLRSSDGKATQPTYLSPSAQMLLGRTYQQLINFSGAHFATGDRIAISMLETPASSGIYQIIWTDLEAASTAQGTGWGIIQRQGDAGDSGGATISHDGQTILYVSGTSIGSGVTTSDGDLYTVPYNNRQGGTAAPLKGASDPAWNEFYPAYSPDDSLVAYSRVPTGMTSYNDSQSEVMLVPAAGGTAVRLVANDSAQCAGKPSPGVTNSWPKWSPAVEVVGSPANEVTGPRRFYWLTFSSTRNDPAGAASATPQLFMSPVMVQGGTITTYPALYFWNQPAGQGNHTPAWDVFKLILG